MEKQASDLRLIRIGAYDLNPRTGELSNSTRTVRLSVQPLRVLLLLLDHPGELVTREEVVQHIWAAGTFVDFDHSLNKAVNKLREALGDSAENPSYIETLPRRGYRLIAPVTVPPSALPPETLPIAALNTATEPRGEASPADSPPRSGPSVGPFQKLPKYRLHRRIWILSAAVAVAIALAWPAIYRQTRHALLKPAPPLKAEIASLAVLPLENLSGDAEQAYFADGMTDALITEIAKVGETRVISRTSIMRYKRTHTPVQQIGRELNVDAIVEGTVQQSGTRVRITAQLIQVSTDTHIWAESFQGDARDVLSLQQEIARNIARRIGAVVKPVEAPGTVNPDAYAEYLKGRFYFLQYSADGWQKAIEHFNRAIQADPNFAPAHSGLAQSYLVAAGWNTFPPDEALQHGREEAQKALALDDSLASSHLAMGVVYDLLYDRPNAAREFARSLELNPNDSLVWQQHGNHVLSEGRFDDAIADQQHALQLDPLSPMIQANLARAFYYARRYDQAIAQANVALKLEPGFPIALRWLERASRHSGRPDQAYQAQLASSTPEERTQLQAIYKASGYRGVLLFEAERDRQHRSLLEAARNYAQAGESGKALESLEENLRRGWPGLERLNVDPDFDPLRTIPRFQRVIRDLESTVKKPGYH